MLGGNEWGFYSATMQRFVLALIAAALVVGLTTLLLRSAAKRFEEAGGTQNLTSGGAMQKLAFFVLLGVILYVSFAGAV